MNRLSSSTRRLGASLALLFFLAPVRSPAQSQSGEYQVKAAFIFHFAQMVEWPPDIFGADGSPLVMCTIGDDSYAAALDSVIDGKQIGSHPIQTRHLHDKVPTRGCHLLVISAKDKKRAAAILAEVADEPVLTIGNSEDFAASGGIIGLSLQDNKVRFDINLNAAQRANLKISSRLLLLAKRVIGGGKQG